MNRATRDEDGRTTGAGSAGRAVRLRAVRWVLGAGAALALCSCVSMERYRESQEATKHYQRAHHDLEQYQAQLEAEVEALRAQSGLLDGTVPADASYTEDIDARLEELRRMEERIAGLGRSGDVEVISFDGGYGYSLRDSVLFDSGSTEIQPDGQKLLRELAGEIRSQPFERLWVRGHTDSDPIVKKETIRRYPHGNLQLSAERALEVAALLVSEGGLEAGRVAIAGFGPSEPVAANDSAEGKRRNRRVEIFVEQEPAQDGR